MLVTLLGSVILVRAEQPLKAEAPILVTLFAIVILVSAVQPLKALALILVPPLIVTVVNFALGKVEIAMVGMVAAVMLLQP